MTQRSSSGIQRRQLIAASLGSTAAAFWPGSVLAQAASQNVVKFVIGSSPGTGPDTMARLMQPQLQSIWSQPVIVENKPGASGVIGIGELAKSPADGSALMIQTSTMFLLPSFYKDIPFDVIKSFQPVTQIGWSTFALVVNESVPAKNYKELVQWIKANPGKASYATPGKGTENHVFTELLRMSEGLDMLHVPYRSTAAAIQDVLGGQVALMFLPIQTANKTAKSGRIRVIGSTMKERFAPLPDIPTLHEQGATAFDFTVWYGVWGPAGMPRDVTEKLNKDVHAVLRSPEVTKAFSEQGWAVKMGTPEELGQLAQKQLATWRDLVAQTKIEAD